jgi:hypothetical protein
MLMRLSALWLVLSTAACGSGDAPPNAGTPSDCEGASAAARDRVVAVASANVSCSADADCTRMDVRASCFDSCSWPVNLTGKGAVDRANTIVEAAECKAFNHAGCRLTVPPCAPPTPVACVTGVCR